MAKLDWATKTKQPETAVPELSDLVPFTKQYLQEETPLACPGGGTYTIGPVIERPRCSQHRSAHLPRAQNYAPDSAGGMLAATCTLGAVNEPPLCSQHARGHGLLLGPAGPER